MCGVVFGAFPALQASGVGGQQALVRGRAPGFAARSHRLRRGLMVVETALALMLLAGAGLMMRTLQQLTRVDTGFRSDHLLTAALRSARASGGRRRAARVLRRAARAHRRAARRRPTRRSPIRCRSTDRTGTRSSSSATSRCPERARLPSAAFTPVSAGYFETMGMRLHARTPVRSTPTRRLARVIVVNETLAKRLWPGEDAVGKRLKQGWPETRPEKPCVSPGAKSSASWRT